MGYRTPEVKNESGMKVRPSPQQSVQLFLTKEINQIDTTWQYYKIIIF